MASFPDDFFENHYKKKDKSFPFKLKDGQNYYSMSPELFLWKITAQIFLSAHKIWIKIQKFLELNKTEFRQV